MNERVLDGFGDVFLPLPGHVLDAHSGEVSDVKGPLVLAQVWSLTQFCSVDFSKSRIGV